MQDSSTADERPTSFAELTIVLVRLPPEPLADERPTRLAELTIERVPLPAPLPIAERQ
jgi:hypothetical protein